MTKPKSGRFHWLKWWPRRWRGDQAVQCCSLAARGAWHELLNVMHLEGSDGVLLIGGEVPDSETIARLLGCTEREWRTVEAELERRKVFSRRPDGAIFCRSSVRESDADGVPQGSPEGDPTGTPPDIPSESNGVPLGSLPSRALSSSCLLTSSGEGGDRGGSPESGPPPKPPRAEPTGPQAECAAHWRSEWARCRAGTMCAPLRRAEYVLIAEMLSFAEPDNVRRRMTAILEDPEEFVRKKASIKLLRSQWDNYALIAAKNGKHAPDKAALAREAEEKRVERLWSNLHSKRQTIEAHGRKMDVYALDVPYPGYEAAKRELAEGVA